MPDQPEIMVSVEEFRADLDRFLAAAYDGSVIRIRAGDRASLRLELPKRRLGGLRGKIWMADDFDTWPEDILEAFEADKFSPEDDRGER